MQFLNLDFGYHICSCHRRNFRHIWRMNDFGMISTTNDTLPLPVPTHNRKQQLSFSPLPLLAIARTFDKYNSTLHWKLPDRTARRIPPRFHAASSTRPSNGHCCAGEQRTYTTMQQWKMRWHSTGTLSLRYWRKKWRHRCDNCGRNASTTWMHRQWVQRHLCSCT